MAGLAPPSQADLVRGDLGLELRVAERRDRLVREPHASVAPDRLHRDALRAGSVRRARGCAGPRGGPPFRSCVTITIVTPNSRFTARNDSSTRSAETESSSAVGSSASSSIGVFESATAIAARCCSPPESCPTLWFAPIGQVHQAPGARPRLGVDPTRAPAWSTPGNRTFSRTDRYGTRFRAVPCHTNPTRWARYVRQRVVAQEPEVLSVHVHDAGGGAVETPQEVQDRGLAGAARADDRQELAREGRPGRRRRARRRRCRRSGRP